jgi:hypothetical protein
VGDGKSIDVHSMGRAGIGIVEGWLVKEQAETARLREENARLEKVRDEMHNFLEEECKLRHEAQAEADNANESARMAEERVARLVESAGRLITVNARLVTERDAAKASNDRLAEALTICLPILDRYVADHPKWVYDGKEQDPSGSHKALEQVREALRERE